MGAEKRRNEITIVIKKNTVLTPLNILFDLSSFENPILLVPSYNVSFPSNFQCFKTSMLCCTIYLSRNCREGSSNMYEAIHKENEWELALWSTYFWPCLFTLILMSNAWNFTHAQKLDSFSALTLKCLNDNQLYRYRWFNVYFIVEGLILCEHSITWIFRSLLRAWHVSKGG